MHYSISERNSSALRLLGGLFLLAAVLFVQTALAASVPQVASAIGREIDRQVVERLGQGESPAQGVSLCITTPVDNNDLDTSNPLARQMQEEVARWFVQAGYDVQEIRKGADILFEPTTGEMLLTRREPMLGTTVVNSTAIVAGTYTVTPKHVRFNIRLVRTAEYDNGAEIDAYDEDGAEYEAVPRNSLIESIKEVACDGNRADPPTWPSMVPSTRLPRSRSSFWPPSVLP